MPGLLQIYLSKERSQSSRPRRNERRKEWNCVCGRLVVEGHQNIAGSVCAGISRADQQMLQGAHAMSNAIDWQIFDLCSYPWVMDAAIPLVVDLICYA